MDRLNDLKTEGLKRIVTVRMTDEDYNILLGISQGRKSNVSNVIRTITGVVIDLAKKNNSKDK